MSQEEVNQFLKKYPKGWFSVKEIANRINNSVGSVTKCIKPMRLFGEVNFKIVRETNLNGYTLTNQLYQYKRGE